MCKNHCSVCNVAKGKQSFFDLDNLICKNCNDRVFRKFRCVSCGREKSGEFFTRYAIDGREAPECSKCRYRGKKYYNHTKPEKIDSVVKRSCLKCGRKFDSMSTSNRMCHNCKGEKEYSVDMWGV